MGKARSSKRSRASAKRVFPKQFGAGYINAYGGLDKDRDNPFTFANRGKAAQRTHTVKGPDGSLRRVYAPTPVTQELTIARADGEASVPRAVVLYKLMQSDRLQNPEPWHPIGLQETSRFRVTLWFSGGRAVLVRERFVGARTVERSIVYPGFKIAQRRFDMDNVTWCEPVPVHSLPAYPTQCSPPPVPPSG